MKALYEEFLSELDKLTRLVTHARANNHPVASDGAIIAQSRKVDALVCKLVELDREEKDT
jgi:hypothetical protein